jgi:hypothetical protein
MGKKIIIAALAGACLFPSGVALVVEAMAQNKSAEKTHWAKGGQADNNQLRVITSTPHRRSHPNMIRKPARYFPAQAPCQRKL